MKPVVLLVGADKGGVGKTTIVRTLLTICRPEASRRAPSIPNFHEEPSSGSFLR